MALLQESLPLQIYANSLPKHLKLSITKFSWTQYTQRDTFGACDILIKQLPEIGFSKQLFSKQISDRVHKVTIFDQDTFVYGPWSRNLLVIGFPNICYGKNKPMQTFVNFI